MLYSNMKTLFLSHWQDKEEHDELLAEQAQRAVVLGSPSSSGAAACIVILLHSMQRSELRGKVGEVDVQGMQCAGWVDAVGGGSVKGQRTGQWEVIEQTATLHALDRKGVRTVRVAKWEHGEGTTTLISRAPTN